MIATLKQFFASPQGAVQGWLSPEELYRSIVTSLGSGAAIGLAVVVLQSIQTHLGSIVPNPTVASLVSVVLTLVLDLLRRQTQGASASLMPPPSVRGSAPQAG